MTVFQRLAQIARPYRKNLASGLCLAVFSTFLETVVVSALLSSLITMVMKAVGENGSASKSIGSLHIPLLSDVRILALTTAVKDHFLSILNHLIDPNDPHQLLTLLAICTALVVLVKCVTVARGNFLMNRFANLVSRDIRQRLFTHLVNLPPAYFEFERTGSQVSRITNDVVILQQCLGPQLSQILQAPVTIVISLTMMFYVNWHLMIVVIILSPLIAALIGVAGRKIRKVSVRMQERLADLNAGLMERLANIRVIQSFVREPYEIAQVKDFNTKYYRETMRSVLIAETLAPGVELIAWIGMVVGIILGGNEVLNGNMSGDNFIFFMLLAQRAGSQFKQLSRVNQLRQQANAAGDRIFGTLDVVPGIQNSANAQSLPTVQGHIVFDHVGFRYHTGDDVLTDINFTVEPGEVIALVGPSGSGKTTLVNLLPRFYDPVTGCILVDGLDLRDITLPSLREQVGIVPQETVLFSGSIYDNILYGKLDATREEIMEAARSANALEFIERLPEGFATLVGERGTRLSGGQRQRVAIARALLKNPRILILDEATSALDTESEHLVQQALDRLMQNRTTFVIAHRLSTVKGATRILVLDQGHIVESGTHAQLLAQGGLYARLYEMQFKTGTVEPMLPDPA